MAQFYANELVTVVQPPDAEQEQDRDLLRTRQKLLLQRAQLRRHMHSLLRRNGLHVPRLRRLIPALRALHHVGSGLHYKAQTGFKSHWTKPHYAWLRRTIKGSAGSLQVNLSLLLRQIRALDEALVEYGRHIEELALTPQYREAVQSLTCDKGIKNLFALTMITEIGDIQRFPHPRQLMSWIGMDVREYSSGGKHNRMGITKQGNRYLRTAFIEANQRGYRSTRMGRNLQARRQDTPPELLQIADRCRRRLNRKGNRLLLSGKHPNKVKVACAREMVGFVWESLSAVAA